MVETILIVLHVVVCFFLVFVVLLQSGQAADLAGAFGGGGDHSAAIDYYGSDSFYAYFADFRDCRSDGDFGN